MVLHLLIPILALFIVSSSQDRYNFDCSEESCFGEPQNCIPSSTCRSVLRFDSDGNVDLYLRNFSDPYSYAAFAIGKEPDETINYLICIPHAQQRLRANSELGKPIKIIEKNMTRLVSRIGRNEYVCSFPRVELNEHFRREQNFFVSVGKFVDNLTIFDGEQLYSLDNELYEDSYGDDDDYGVISSIPISGRITLPKNSNHDVFSKNENDAASDMIQSLERISKTEEDENEFEDKLEKQISIKVKNRSNAKDLESFNDSDDSNDSTGNKISQKSTKTREDDKEDYEWKKLNKEIRKISKIGRSRVVEDEENESEENPRRSRISKGPSRRKNVDDDDELEYSDDYEEKPRRRKAKKSRRPSDYDDDEDEERYTQRRRKFNSRRFTDDYEEGDPEKLRDLEKKMRRMRKEKKERKYAEYDAEDDYDEELYDDDDNFAFNNQQSLIALIIFFSIYIFNPFL